MILELDNTHARVAMATVEEKEWLADYLSFDTMDWRTKTMKRHRLYNIAAERFPAGFLTSVIKKGNAEGKTVEVVDIRPPAVPRDPTADIAWLRDYQREAVEAALKQERGILWLPTGAGKTATASAIANCVKGKWLFLVHRVSLLKQSAEAFERFTGEQAGIIGEDGWLPRRFTAATFQTIVRKLATPQGKALMQSLDGIIVDECFPAGTLVDGKPIEQICVGDMVTSYDETSKTLVKRPVTRLFKNKANSLVRVHFSDGTSVVCTPQHPFLTASNHWLPAESLCGSDVLRMLGGTHGKDGTVPQNLSVQSMRSTVVSDDIGRKGTCEGVLRRLPNGALEGAKQESGSTLQGVRCRCAFARSLGIGAGTGEQGLLLTGTQASMDAEAAFRSQQDRSNKVCLCGFRTNETSQPDVSCGCEGAGASFDDCQRTQTEGAGRERATPASSAQDATRCIECGDVLRLGGRVYDPHQKTDGTSICDQVGHSQPATEDRNRSGWGFASHVESQREGCSKDGVFELVRVDSVEILEPTSDGQFGGVCAGGVVYNIEVEGTHTYTINGIVVHNCHVAPAETHYRVIQCATNARYRIGLSGTPLARGDKKSVYVVAALGPVIFRIRPELLIERGVLSRPNIKLINVLHSNIRSDRWQDVYREGVVESEKRNRMIVEAVKRTPKPALVFVQIVDHGRTLLKMLHRAGLNAEFVWGDASTEQRQASIKRLVRGDLDVLICSVIFQEGVDIPALQSVVIATGGASAIAAIQRVGRGMRMAEGKNVFTVWDVADRGHRWLEKHTKQRLKAYEREGYEVVSEQIDLPGDK